MKMKNKIIPIAVISLIVILAGIWLYPSNDSTGDDLTGTVVSTETTEEVNEVEDNELEEISGEALIGKCISECGVRGGTDLERDIWKSICNKKYNQGEEEIREFIRSC